MLPPFERIVRIDRHRLLPYQFARAKVRNGTVAGQYFPQRAVEPEVLVGEIASDFSRISVDQRNISGFFRHSLPEGEVVRVRYGDSQERELEQRFFGKLVIPLPHECGE